MRTDSQPRRPGAFDPNDMRSKIHDEAVDLLLASMSRQSGDGLRASFFFGTPGAPRWDRRMGIDIYYNAKKLIRASLYVRQNGPAYLRYLSIDAIWSKLQTFVVDNYWHLASDRIFDFFEGSYAENVPQSAKASFAEALAASDIFQPRNELTLFPLVPIQVEADFDSEPYFLITPSSLPSHLTENIDPRHIAPEQFPPLSDWKGLKHSPNAWLGIRSPDRGASSKMKAAILGALALTPLPRYRHVFSMRQTFGGACTLGDGSSTTFGEAHTPGMMNDIIVTGQDHEWLAMLAEKLLTNERAARRQLSALEYFYRAWPLEPSERFPILCMSLDGIFGDANSATQAVIDGVHRVLGSHVRRKRLGALMGLRASVIHGGAPDVYDSRQYARYYNDYEADPIHDLELVVASCLRVQIFGDKLKEHADPNVEIIAEAQAKGQLPKKLARGTILEDDPTTDAA